MCRIDAGTQTTCERKLSDERRLRDDIAVGSLEDEVLWSRSRNLPACISALAIQGEAAVGAVGSQTHCLRKLEVRVASCWRHSDGQQASSLKGSEHSSLQLSSTQSPSSAQENLCSEGSVGGRHRLQHTPCNSLSSVSSPLENSSLLKDTWADPSVTTEGCCACCRDSTLNERRNDVRTLMQQVQHGTGCGTTLQSCQSKTYRGEQKL